jgi:beta-glucosidase
VFRPEQELRAFAKVGLEPGASETVRLTLDARAFAYWHVRLSRWVVEGGEFGIRVGASSRDIRLTGSVALQGQKVREPLTAESTVNAWLEDPRGNAWLMQRVGTDTPLHQMLFDPQHGEVMRAIPLQRLSRFPGIPISEAEVDAAVADLRT